MKHIYINHIRFEIETAFPIPATKLCELVLIPIDNADIVKVTYSVLTNKRKEIPIDLDKMIVINGGEEFLIMRKYVLGG